MNNKQESNPVIVVMFNDTYKTLVEAKLEGVLVLNVHDPKQKDKLKETLSDNDILENLALYELCFGDKPYENNILPIVAQHSPRDMDRKCIVDILRGCTGGFDFHRVTNAEDDEQYLLSNFPYDYCSMSDDSMPDLNDYHLHRIDTNSYILTVNRDIELKYIVNHVREAVCHRLLESFGVDLTAKLAPGLLVKHCLYDHAA